MKKFVLLILLLPTLLIAQHNAVIFNDTKPQKALDYDGSTEYQSGTPALKLTGVYSLQEDFSDGDYTGWTVSSGDYAVNNSVANPLSTNQYSLVCNTAGLISIPCNQAYGRWKFHLYKGADGNESFVYFISSVASIGSSYRIGYNSAERIRLYKDAVTLAGTNTAYINNTTWYELTVERNTNGQFYFYVQGGIYTTKTLVSVTGGDGTNPVTDNTYTFSNYFVLDLDAGDRISNIVCEFGSGSLDLNGFERTKFSFDRDGSGPTNWTGNGNHTIVDSSTVDKKTGSYSYKMTSSAAGDATTNYISLASDKFTALGTDANSIYEKYTFELWARGTGIEGSATYTSNFGTDADGWTNLAGSDVVEGNIDGVGGEDDVLRLTSDGATGNHATTKTVGTSGVTYKLTYKYYIPSANTTIKRLGAYSGTTIIGTINTATDTWTTVTVYYVAGATTLRFYGANSSSAISFAGTAGDLFYIKDVVLTPITLPSLTAVIGGQNKTVTNISCVPGTFTKFVWNFQATANEVNQPIKIYANQADDIYIDDVSLTKAWDVLLITWAKDVDIGGNTNVMLDYGDATSATLPRYRLGKNSVSDKAEFIIRDDNTTATITSGLTVPTSNYTLLGLCLNRIANGEIFQNGVSQETQGLTNIGRIYGSGLTIGYKRASASSNTYWSGQIGEVQIVRFTDISQSNVSAATLKGLYERGKAGKYPTMPNTWNNGSIVFWQTLEGSTTADILRDRSASNTTMSGTNLDIQDLVKRIKLYW